MSKSAYLALDLGGLEQLQVVADAIEDKPQERLSIGSELLYRSFWVLMWALKRLLSSTPPLSTAASSCQSSLVNSWPHCTMSFAPCPKQLLKRPRLR